MCLLLLLQVKYVSPARDELSHFRQFHSPFSLSNSLTYNNTYSSINKEIKSAILYYKKAYNLLYKTYVSDLMKTFLLLFEKFRTRNSFSNTTSRGGPNNAIIIRELFQRVS